MKFGRFRRIQMIQVIQIEGVQELIGFKAIQVIQMTREI